MAKDSSMHILLIEDDPAVAQSVRLMLEAEKFQSGLRHLERRV